MKKFYYYINSIKRNTLPICFLIFTIFLVIFSKTNLKAAKEGLNLWSTSIVPSLLPFFIATELLSYTNITNYIGRLLNKFMKPIFNVPGEGAYAFIIGIISGYPVGAKVVAKLRNDGLCTKSEGERMLCFSNNSGPLFILGTIGASMFGNSTIGLLLLITHLASSITVGILLGFIDRIFYNKKNKKNFNTNYKQISNNHICCNFTNLGEILSKSITNAITNVFIIGGFVVLFSVIISMLQNSNILNFICIYINKILSFFNIDNNLSKSIIFGIIELTNGVKLASSLQFKSITPNIIVCAFLLGFGGFSILLQVLSITSKTDLSIKPYILGKLLQGIFASIYTWILIKKFPFLNFDLVDVFANNSNRIFTTENNLIPVSFIIITIFIILLTYKLSKFNLQKFYNK